MHKTPSVLIYGILSFLGFTLTLTYPQITFGQSPINLLAQNNRFPPQPPLINSQRIGNIIYAPVKLDGRILFPVAAEASSQSSGSNILSPIEARVQIIEHTLEQIIQVGFDPNTLTVTPETTPNQIGIFASDQKQLQPVRILTLSELDALICGLSIQESAEHLAHLTHEALLRANQERTPEYLRQQALISSGIFLAMIAASSILRWQQKRKRQECLTLQTQMQPPLDTAIPDPEMALDANAAQMQEHMMEAAVHHTRFEQQLNLNSLKQHLILLGHILIWGGGIAIIFGLFPYTRWWQRLALSQPLILAVLLLTILAIKYSSFLIDSFLNQWAKRPVFSQEETYRWHLRILSFAPVLKGITTGILGSMSLLLILYSLGIPLGPVFGTLGIFGLAISLASQALIRDAINGTLILIEDQYAMGDFIIINNILGRVERLTLRITTLRNPEGNLITIPNSEIKIVNNLSKDWARLNLLINVAYKTDMNHAIDTLHQVATELKNDDFWAPQIRDVKIRGIENINSNSFTLGFRIETKPEVLQEVAREFRRRIKLAFDREEIMMG